MSRPDFRRGYLRVPFSVWMKVFCRPLLTRRQIKLVSFVIRESWGWQTAGREPRTWTRPLASRDFALATGLSTDDLRRVLLALIERGVFREDHGRYQFISDPQLWKTLPARPPEPRYPPPQSPAFTAVPARFSPGSNKGNISKDNGFGLPVEALHPPVDNSPSSFVASTVGLRLADIVAAFVGSLSEAQADALRRWICEAGVAGVWAALEPAFREGPLVAREHFEALIEEKLPSIERDAADGKEADA